MKMIKLTKKQARQFLLIKHGLNGDYKFEGKDGILNYTKQVGCIQYDPIDACGKNADLVLLSKVKGYKKKMLDELLYQDRELIDYFDKNLAIFCKEDWIYLKRKQKTYDFLTRHNKNVEMACDLVKKAIKENGPMSASDFKNKEQITWTWGNKSSLSRACLEHLYYIGELGIHHKKGTIKYYDLIENCISIKILNKPDPNKTEIDYLKWNVLRRISAVGMLWNKASDAYLCIENLKANKRNEVYQELLQDKKIIQFEVEGCKEILYCLSTDLYLIKEVIKNPKLKKRCEFIAPLDNMMWDRNLIRELFEFDYKWEIYTPQSQRKYGYYVLPILYGDIFVGRIEAVYTKKNKLLEVKNIWFESSVKPTKKLESEIAKQIKKLEKFNQEEL